MGLGRYAACAVAISALAFGGCPKEDTKYSAPAKTPESHYVQPYESNDLEKKVQEKPAKDGEYQNPVTDMKKALKDADDALAKLADAYKDLEEVEKELDEAMRDKK